MKVMTLVGFVLTVALALGGCQSAPVAVEKADQGPGPATSIAVGDNAYYPLTQSTHGFLVFYLNFDRPDLIRSWSVQWKDQSGATVYEITGAPPFLPTNLTWDGRTGDGSWSASGVYIASLFVDYGGSRPDLVANSDAFRLAQPPVPTPDQDNFSIDVNDSEDSLDSLE